MRQAADRAVAAAESTASPAEVERAVADTDWGSALPHRASSAGWGVSQGVKRTLDCLLAVTGLVALMPVLVVIAVLILLDSAWRILYPWRVLGLRGRAFTGYKFRTMVHDADYRKAELLHLNETRGPVFKMRYDPRATRLGRWLRRDSFDELPQLWSVLVGDMSLVGPRPMFPDEFVRAAPWQRRKLAVRPGLTCLWQVSGRAAINDFQEWARRDLEYISRWSLWLNFVVLARCVTVVLRGTGAY